MLQIEICILQCTCLFDIIQKALRLFTCFLDFCESVEDFVSFRTPVYRFFTFCNVPQVCLSTNKLKITNRSFSLFSTIRIFNVKPRNVTGVNTFLGL